MYIYPYRRHHRHRPIHTIPTAGRDQGGLRRHGRHPPHGRRGLRLPRRHQVQRGACPWWCGEREDGRLNHRMPGVQTLCCCVFLFLYTPTRPPPTYHHRSRGSTWAAAGASADDSPCGAGPWSSKRRRRQHQMLTRRHCGWRLGCERDAMQVDFRFV